MPVMTTQQAAVICDSISPQGNRLTTFKLRYHKFIHGEFMTHRALSRNASSSRAVPVAKLIAEVRDDALRAAPLWWGAEQKGMQSGDELSKANPEHNVVFKDSGIGYCQRVGCGFQTDVKGFWPCTSPQEEAEVVWTRAAISAANSAEHLVAIGAHKSIVNRLLEPFSHINVVASGTDDGWMNFFGLRLDKAAQPEMRALAELMWRAYGESTPQLLDPGTWHLPFVDDDDKHEIAAGHTEVQNPIYFHDDHPEMIADTIKVSVARCARVSYESFETGRRSTVAEDLALYERLVGAQPLHASPAEHQATPDTPCVFDGDGKPRFDMGDNCWLHSEERGNFGLGWRQYRKMLPGEALAPLPEEYVR